MAPDDALVPPGCAKDHNPYLKAYLNSKLPFTLLSHDLLLSMGHGGLKAYFDGEDSPPNRLQKISRIWQDLLTTTKSTAVTDRHLTAACNALCVFLECACSSPLQSVKDFGMARETWLQCFRAILESFEEGKVKPMRQVLITLANILAHNPDHDVSSSIRKDILTQMTSIILLGETGHVKAALVAMELFIRKVFSFHEVLQCIESCVHSREVEWSRRLAAFGVEKALSDLPVSASLSDLGSVEPDYRTTIAFVLSILMALLSRDTQSAAIALYKTYSTALIASGNGYHIYSVSTLKKGDRPGAGHVDNHLRANQSRWIVLVQTFLEVYPAALTPFTDFLFPTVFKHDPNGYKEYADTLHKDDSSLINLLAVIQVGCHIGLENGKLLFFSSLVENARKHPLLMIPPSDPALTIKRAMRGIDVPCDQSSNIYGSLLSHAVADVRIRTFALLLASSSTTTPLLNAVLQCLMSHMKYLYGDTDPQNRGEVMSKVRKLVIRLQGGAYSLHKSLLSSPSQPAGETANNPSTDLRQHEKFLLWFANFLESELRPDIAYQRHIMALKSIELLLRSGLDRDIGTGFSTEVGQKQTPWPIHVSLRHPSLIYALLNLVMDPFEDVRTVSSILLEILGSAIALAIRKPITCLVRRAEELASSTSRADHADGTARLYKLYYKLTQDSLLPGVTSPPPSKRAIVEQILSSLQMELASIQGDLDVPIQQVSLHARILSLSYILQDRNFPGDVCQGEALKSNYQEMLLGRMICICQVVWQKVRARLCIDSPENAEDDVDEEFSVGPKDVLSYSWRALRDSSLLACAILEAPIFRGHIALSPSSPKYLESIGLLCMDQLSNLRHRGAFSTVAQTFFTLCGRIGEINDGSIDRLRDVWYESAVATIDQQSTRLTRRSAGLPAMIIGLLNGCSQPFFDRFIQSFKERSRIANNSFELSSTINDLQIEIPQVHALNCLKEVFTNARFRSLTEPYVMDMLNLAATSLSCDLWAIRNCGLMLFRACTSRLGRARPSLFPVGELPQSWASEGTVSNERAWYVLDLAMNLLDPGCFSKGPSHVSSSLQADYDLTAENNEVKSLVTTERIFAALDLIGRVSPSFSNTDHVERVVLEKLSSNVWQVREQAARVYASRISPWDALELLGSVLDGMSLQSNQNTIHGRLLCMKQILRLLWRSRAQTLSSHLEGAASILKPLIAHIMVGSMSAVVRTTFLDILNDAFETEIVSCTSSANLCKLSFWAGEDILRNAELSDGPDFPNHESAALHEAYQLFSTVSGPEEQQPSISKLRFIFLNLAKVDFDAAARFLVRLASQDAWNQNIRTAIDGLYQFIIPHDLLPEDIKSKATAGLTASIESKKFDSALLTNENEISWCMLYDVKPQGRDWRNAKLRLQANLFTLSDSFTQMTTQGQSDLSSWVAMLEDAAWDEVDTPTRLNAASSLLAFTPVLLLEQLASTFSSLFLQIYLLLYDLLNDDDEEVREIAASATSTILSSGKDMSFILTKQSPLAASESLALYLSCRFRNERHFELTAWKRIWFSSTSTQRRGSVEQEITSCSVKSLLESLQMDSNALFEEERQNLYIDDVREVEIWSKVLKSITGPEEGCLNSLGDWVLAGLRDLVEYLNDEVDFDGPLGRTSEPEVLILFVRVIELAGVLLSLAGRQQVQVHEPQSPAAPDISVSFMPTNLYDGVKDASPAAPWVASISLELKALEKLGRRLCIHERIMRSIEEIIEKQ